MHNILYIKLQQTSNNFYKSGLIIETLFTFLTLNNWIFWAPTLGKQKYFRPQPKTCSGHQYQYQYFAVPNLEVAHDDHPNSYTALRKFAHLMLIRWTYIFI